MNRTVAFAAACAMVAAAWAGQGTPLQQAPATTARLKNPFAGSTDARRSGAKLYARECAACHGTDGEGRNGAPPLNRREVVRASPGALFWVLRNGAIYGGMPSFAHLPEPQRWQIITFLRSLGSGATDGESRREQAHTRK